MPQQLKHEIELEGIARKLGAEIYAESSGFICILPADVHNSITAKGKSVAEAVENWEIKLKAHLRNASSTDLVVIEVKKTLALSGLNMESYQTPGKIKSNYIIEFEKQLYHARKRLVNI